MATLAELQTDLETAEAALRALYTGVDFTSAGGGGSLSVRVSEQIKALRQEIKYLRQRIAVAGGTLAAVSPRRQGIDVDDATDNGDQG
jgi:uncharacterized protein involved in exopolysaccharide biosynthesis